MTEMMTAVRLHSLAQYVTAPAGNVYTVPGPVSLDTATYVEPLACAIHGQDRIGIRSGDRVLIIGGGPMGLAHLALSRLSGASKVIVSEPDERRRELSGRLGARRAPATRSTHRWSRQSPTSPTASGPTS
jgi:threonine dehydrogenase-like Zn-dependent dehydrogenase